jgi:peptidoglycan/LPS O-acetylase OafA/YrhL
LLSFLILAILILRFTFLFSYIGVYLISFAYIVWMEYLIYRKETSIQGGIGVPLYEKLLIQIGICSYSIYLIHQPFLNKLIQTFDFLGLSKKHYLFYAFNVSLVFLLLFLISYSLFVFLEVPSIRLGENLYKRFTKSKSKTIQY